MVRGHHLHPCVGRLLLSRGRDGLGHIARQSGWSAALPHPKCSPTDCPKEHWNEQDEHDGAATNWWARWHEGTWLAPERKRPDSGRVRGRHGIPPFKLGSNRRDGARVSKRYHAPATPSQRLLADPRTPAAVCERVAELSTSLIASAQLKRGPGRVAERATSANTEITPRLPLVSDREATESNP